MKSCTRKVIIATALGTLAMASVSLADEEKISVKELPKAVLKVVKEKFPKSEIKGAAKEEEDGKTTYEVMLSVKGRGVNVALKADGTVLEIEKEIDVDDLPKAVRETLSARYPKAKIAKAEAVTKGEGGPVSYEVAITTEVVLSAKGKIAGAGARKKRTTMMKSPKPKARSPRRTMTIKSPRPKARSRRRTTTRTMMTMTMMTTRARRARKSRKETSKRRTTTTEPKRLGGFVLHGGLLRAERGIRSPSAQTCGLALIVSALAHHTRGRRWHSCEGACHSGSRRAGRPPS